jgi:hypothetical protein
MIVYVAYGNKAIHEVSLSIDSLRKYNDYPITIICKESLDIRDVTYVTFKKAGYGARWAKLNIPNLVDSEIIGYLDADTRIHESLESAFGMVRSGWDMVLSYSMNQGSDVMVHIEPDEREMTLADNPFPLQAQCGVMFFNREKCMEFFGHWRYEWNQYKKQDQAAFIRALSGCPIRMTLLGRPWNGGDIVEHLFGRAHG